MPDLQGELDRLYGLPLDEFTSARNELAKRLKADKEQEGAEEVRALPKPSVPAWAVNQLSRSQREGIGKLLDAGAALREAQERLLRGSADAASLRAATARVREAVQRLVDQAPALLAGAGRPAPPAMLERIGRTLQAAAVDEEGRELLKTGRLTEELEPPGFDAFSGFPAAEGGRPGHARDELAERRQAQEERRRRKRELQQEVRDLERAAREAERDAERAAAAAAAAQRLAESARAAADDAAAALAELG